MTKCSICKLEPVTYSWQPFGPDESILSFVFPGSHYRGFAVVPVCDTCKSNIESNPHTTFRHKNYLYQAQPNINRIVMIGGSECAPF